MAWEWGSVITSMFSHGGLLHLFGNMLFLYLYGDNLEDAMGKMVFSLLFILRIFCSDFPVSNRSILGDSHGWGIGSDFGSDRGLLTALPAANIRVFYWIFLFVGTMYLPAYLVLGLWLLEQVFALPDSMKQAGRGCHCRSPRWILSWLYLYSIS